MSQPELEVRIPVKFVDMMMAEEITGSILLTMLMLYRWANWRKAISVIWTLRSNTESP